MAGKGKGFLDKIVDSISEHDEPDAKSSPAAAPAAPAPAVAPAGGFGFGPIGSPATTPLTQPMAAQQVMTPQNAIDPEAIQAVKQQVYVPTLQGRSSNFMLFMTMWDTLGRPADANQVIKVLQVTQPQVTVDAVLADIQQHTALLDNTAAAAKQTFDSVAADRLGGNDNEIASLTKANEDAVKEIERHQREIAERSQRLQALTQERANTEAQLQRARQRAVDAEGVVRQELASMKNLFGSH